ncbi:NUDIX domain-containing protein [Planomonospora sp. ID82291]|uniref:NUDIX domain-containing protein n=1 Tax=Planomonospora sp. ID82291 TaxID=2738136 RepID=UPI0035AC028F
MRSAGGGVATCAAAYSRDLQGDTGGHHRPGGAEAGAGRWTLPGGAVDPEGPADALVREMREELGCRGARGA